MADSSVRLIFLGGIAEVGKNMLLLESGEDIVVVDCGVGFPGEDQFGIDLVLPDIAYLRERAERVRGIFVTHGHEDHIGALPYLLPELPAPVHATRLTLGLIAGKLEEAGILARSELVAFDPDSRPTIAAGVFAVEPFRVCHSIPDAVGFGVGTPAGLVVVTGDFKFDPTPVDGRETDWETLEAFGRRGVRLLVSDCVHVETPGQTPSERVVGETYDRVFAEADGRVIIATFASLIARVQQVVDVAARHGRRVVTLGRSLETNVRIARELGYLTDPRDVLIERREAASLPDARLVYLVTGSQGEPLAVLSRIANGEHRDLRVGPGDTVIVSATPIPGNETAVYRIIDRLFRAGARVLYPGRALVHVSGHASRDELGLMLDLTRPQHVLPTHGEHRHLALYAELAAEHGLPPERITLAEAGDVVEVTPETVAVTGRIALRDVFVDGRSVGPVGEAVLRDRRALAQDGILTVVVALDRETGALLVGPEVVTRGFVDLREAGELIDAMVSKVRDALGDGHALYEDGGRGLVASRIREAASGFLWRETRRRPIVVPLVLEV